MAYRIQHSQIDGAISVVVTGLSTLAAAGCIARDIAALAAQESARCVLVDLRWLEDTVGMRAFLNLPWLRVAVLDIGENDAGGADTDYGHLRYFANVTAALRWLQADPRSPRGDRKAPTPAGAALLAQLAILGG
jgi:hypothetical protein